MKLPMPKMTNVEIAKFWSYTCRTGDENCWLWFGAHTGAEKEEYRRAYFRLRENHYIAARLAFYLTYKVDPGDLEVCHKCENKSCINPNHLYLATHQENMEDYFINGGQPSYGNTRLSSMEVDMLRDKYSKGIKPKELAEEFGVSKHQVHMIVSYKQRKNF